MRTVSAWTATATDCRPFWRRCPGQRSCKAATSTWSPSTPAPWRCSAWPAGSPTSPAPRSAPWRGEEVRLSDIEYRPHLLGAGQPPVRALRPAHRLVPPLQPPGRAGDAVHVLPAGRASAEARAERGDAGPGRRRLARPVAAHTGARGPGHRPVRPVGPGLPPRPRPRTRPVFTAVLWGVALWLYAYHLFVVSARAFVRMARGPQRLGQNPPQRGTGHDRAGGPGEGDRAGRPAPLST